MSDYISREEIYKIFSCNKASDEIVGIYEKILDLPSADVRENIHGEWKMPIQDDGMSDPIYYQVRCSKCGFDLDPQTWHQELHQYGADNFCPNCGSYNGGNK